MPEFLQFPIAALVWDIWKRNRDAVLWVIGLTCGGFLVRLAAPIDDLKLLLAHAFGVCVLLVLATFGYVEGDLKTNANGFPSRLFTLPLTSCQLVATPILSGVLAMEFVFWIWAKFIFEWNEKLILSAILLGAYMVTYQMTLWTLNRLLATRLIVLGLAAFIFIAALIETTGPGATYSEGFLSLVFTGVAIGAFLTSWRCVARQRSGGREYFSSITAVWKVRLSDWLPGRTAGFRSRGAAQVWFEWRRSGFVLPAIVGGLLLFVFAPVSWFGRGEPVETLWILGATLIMPLLLAAMVGKAFSKPDLWSSDLSVPGVVAIRPISSWDMVRAKLRVASLSVAVSWLLIALFDALWLTLWANLTALTAVRIALTQRYGSSTVIVCALGILIAAVFLTWRNLIISLWLGLSGAQKIFGLTAIPYVLIPFIALGVSIRLSHPHPPILPWLYGGLSIWLPTIRWIVAAALILKMVTAILSLRRSSASEVQRVFFFWAVGALVSAIWVTFAWRDVQQATMLNLAGVQSIVILCAVAAVPLGRICLAPRLLARNRHR